MTAAVVGIRSGSVAAWILAARPKTLTAAVSPVVVGTACALSAESFRSGPALAALLGAIALQIGANFANDVFDHELGADTSERMGPLRAVQSGLLSGERVKAGMGVAFALAVFSGTYLVAIAGWPIVVIGLASILSAIAYTGGPYPLGYHGLGDVFVFVFFGPVAVCGTAFVQAGHVPAVAPWAAIPVGAIATAVLVINNIRDIPTDTAAGKRTLAVRLGRSRSLAQFGLLLVASYTVPIVLVAREVVSPWGLLPLLTLPLAAARWARVAKDDGPALNASLAGTAALLLGFSALFAVGIAVR